METGSIAKGKSSRRLGLLLGVLLSLASTRAFADTEITPCLAAAGDRYRIPPELLFGIAKAESGLDRFALNVNENGTTDIGIMQVNSWWLPRLAAYGIGEDDLWDPCLNIHVGAWILALSIDRYGYTWHAVGAYHAGTSDDPRTEERRRAYAHRVSRHLARNHTPRVHHHVAANP